MISAWRVPTERVRAAERTERGSSLIFALVFITSLAFILSAVMLTGQRSLSIGGSLEQHRIATYGADGGVDLAIMAMRQEIEEGRYGETCPDRTMTLADGTVAQVTCTPISGSGASVTAPGAQLEYAVMTEPSVNEAGIAVTGANTTVRIRGSVGADGPVSVADGSDLVVAPDAGVLASGECSGDVSPDPTCEADVDAARASAYQPFTAASPNTSGLANRTVPACPTTTPYYVALSPGRYSNAAALSALTDGSCPNALVHLEPGVFRFDFGSGGTWLIDDTSVNVVAGAPKGWSVPASGAARPRLDRLTAMCKTDMDSGINEGALLVFDPDARLDVRASGPSELCGYGATWADQRVSVYQSPLATLSAPGTPLLKVGATDGRTRFVVRGTVYARAASVEVRLRQNVTARFDRGVYVRAVSLPGYATSALHRSFTPFTLAGCATSFADRRVQLDVEVDGELRGRAIVQFTDGGGETPGAVVRVLSYRTY